LDCDGAVTGVHSGSGAGTASDRDSTIRDWLVDRSLIASQIVERFVISAGSQHVSFVSEITFSAIEFTVAMFRFSVSTLVRIFDLLLPGGGGSSVTVGIVGEEMVESLFFLLVETDRFRIPDEFFCTVFGAGETSLRE
jgi:hypothetical protein